MDDKIKNKIDESVGRVKEAVGKGTGNDRLRREGAVEKNSAKLKDKVQDMVDKAKDAVDDVKDSFKK